jgi:hypothetical protein
MQIRLLPLLAASVVLTVAAPKKEVKPKKNLWVAISVNRPVFVTKKKNDSFIIAFGIVNEGDKPVDPEINSSKLFVNGKEIKDWLFILAGGPRDDSWKAVPPQGHLSFGYALWKYFRKPGVYKVQWKGKSFQSPPIVFRVLPRQGK